MIGLEYIMRVKGLSKVDIAKKLGISKQSVGMWFSKYNKIPKQQLPILSRFLNIPEESLERRVENELLDKVAELIVTDEVQLFETLVKVIELKGIEDVKNKLNK